MRKHISKKTRALVFEKDKGCCYLCGEKIAAGEIWDLEHEIALDLGGLDEMSNYRVAHKECHKDKSRADIKLIAKGRRIRRNLDPETRKRSKRPIPSPSKPWPSQKMGKREWKTNVKDVNS